MEVARHDRRPLLVLELVERFLFTSSPRWLLPLYPYLRYVSDHLQLEAAAAHILHPSSSPSPSPPPSSLPLYPAYQRLAAYIAGHRLYPPAQLPYHLSLVRLHLSYGALDTAVAHYDAVVPHYLDDWRSRLTLLSPLVTAACDADHDALPRLRSLFWQQMERARHPVPLVALRAVAAAAQTEAQVRGAVAALRQRLKKRPMEVEEMEAIEALRERWPQVGIDALTPPRSGQGFLQWGALVARVTPGVTAEREWRRRVGAAATAEAITPAP